MPQPSDRTLYERVLRALRRQIVCLRYNPEKHERVIGRLQALSHLSRIRTQTRDNTRLRHLSDILQSFLPPQISLLKAGRSNDLIVAEALARMVLEFCALPDAAFDDEDYVGPDGRPLRLGDAQHIRRRADLEADADDSEMDPSDDSYIARVLLGPTWNDDFVDIEVIIDL
ncbi:uncharacterized protein N7515_008804 [Penicillium bovifimosum]|uniref:Uncharacterized protein n=1 Tax=Penicillium bovifimosum TaxID=126998 RepID=A0A9W9GP39_9EURO|nr:uncharacterized protein N7515_008804 [Penicillium bovifimosum]KAJ5124979.1 hypothetical protein N7515_008804 [Penicillium bovifimosum]